MLYVYVCVDPIFLDKLKTWLKFQAKNTSSNIYIFFFAQCIPNAVMLCCTFLCFNAYCNIYCSHCQWIIFMKKCMARSYGLRHWHHTTPAKQPKNNIIRKQQQQQQQTNKTWKQHNKPAFRVNNGGLKEKKREQLNELAKI